MKTLRCIVVLEKVFNYVVRIKEINVSGNKQTTLSFDLKQTKKVGKTRT